MYLYLYIKNDSKFMIHELTRNLFFVHFLYTRNRIPLDLRSVLPDTFPSGILSLFVLKHPTCYSVLSEES